MKRFKDFRKLNEDKISFDEFEKKYGTEVIKTYQDNIDGEFTEEDAMEQAYQEYLNESLNINQELTVYRGINRTHTNATYGGVSDDGLGRFWTDNKVMASWFAGIFDYNVDTDKYETIPGNGFVETKKIKFKNPYIIDEKHDDYDIDNDSDSFQIYMNEIDRTNGVENYKKTLLSKKYDGLILKGCNTNYYEDGTYNIYIEL